MTEDMRKRLIGTLLDAWDGVDNSTKSDLLDQYPSLHDALQALFAAVESGQFWEAALSSAGTSGTAVRTELIHIAAEIVNRRYLPNLEGCRTIRDARSRVDMYDRKHVDLAMRLKEIALRGDSLSGKGEATKEAT